MKEKIKNIVKNRNFIDITILIFVTLLISFPLVYEKLDVYYDDGIQHIARAFGTAISNPESKLFNKVIFSFSNGYGYSWDLFYGPLSVRMILLCSLVCKTFVNSYKLCVLISLLLSGIFMYKFVKDFVKNRNVGILAAILYMTFPYHLTDLYTRNALGEYLSFMFIPIVFHGIYSLFYKEKGSYLLTLGAVGLILTHNLSTAMVAIFSIFYVLLNVKKLKSKKIIINLVLNIIAIVCITIFFWAPMLEAKMMSNYQVYEENMMSTKESVAGSGLSLKQLFVTVDDGSFVFELGPHIIIMFAFSFFTFQVIRKDLKQIYGFCLFAGLFALWMTTKYFPWKIMPNAFMMIQFPWRMMMMVSFFFSIVCAINMFAVIIKFDLKDVCIISAISILYIMAIFNMLVNFREEPIVDVGNYELGKFSGREIETIAGCGKGEYLPVKAYENRFYIATREDAIYVLKGKALIENENKDGGKYQAKITTGDADYTIFELPYIYYPGYVVKLDGIETMTFETENGLLGFAMRKEDNADLEVSYEGSEIMKYSLLVTIFSSIVFAILNIKMPKTLKKEEK